MGILILDLRITIFHYFFFKVFNRLRRFSFIYFFGAITNFVDHWMKDY